MNDWTSNKETYIRRLLSELINNPQKNRLTTIEFCDLVKVTYGHRITTPVVERIIGRYSRHYAGVKLDENTHLIYFSAPVKFESFIKVKSMLKFMDNNNAVVASYDFSNGKRMIGDVEVDSWALNNGWICDVIETVITNNWEWLFNFIRFDEVSDYGASLRLLDYVIKDRNINIPQKEPKGFLNYYNEKYGKNPTHFQKALGEFTLGEFAYNLISSHWRYNNIPKEFFIENEKILKKIAINSIKNNDFSVNLQSLLTEIAECNFDKDYYKTISETLNENLGVAENIRLIKNIIDAEQNNRIAKQLQRINALNNTEITINGETRVIVIPQNVDDLVEEGTNQHNCVGYNYNSAIARGQFFIAFLRKKENVNKSYITYQYELSTKSAYQFKYSFNQNIYSDDVNRLFIRELTNRITNLI